MISLAIFCALMPVSRSMPVASIKNLQKYNPIFADPAPLTVGNPSESLIPLMATVLGSVVGIYVFKNIRLLVFLSAISKVTAAL